VEDELRPFVGREATREPDRQRVRIEHRATGHDAHGAAAFGRPALAQPLADEDEEFRPQQLSRGPDIVIRNFVQSIPERRIVVPIEPILAEVSFEEIENRT
jgi:hypothetical protein